VGVSGYLKSSADTGHHPCYVENISAGGIFIRADRVIPDGTAVELSLVRPGMKKAIRLTGHIVGVRKKDGTGVPPGLRIRFDAQPEEVLGRISALLQEEPREEAATMMLDQVGPDLETRVKDLQRALEDAIRELSSRGQRIAELERILVRAKEAIAQRDAYIRSLPRAGA
jgi:hypothetical protein